MPLTRGHMDVPDMMLNFTRLVSLTSSEGEFSPVQAARMSTPGAVMSGLRISGARRFGPRLEKDAILGDDGVLPVTVPRNTIIATGDAFAPMYFLISLAAANVVGV